MKRDTGILIGTCLVLIPMIAFGQDAVPAPTFLDGVIKFISELSPSLIAGLLVVVEFILRATPSVKPLSILVPAKYACQGLAFILEWAAGLLDKLIIVAQNTKPK